MANEAFWQGRMVDRGSVLHVMFMFWTSLYGFIDVSFNKL